MSSLFRRIDPGPFPPLRESYRDGRRWYVTPTGAAYASVTSVLSFYSERDGGLQRWRDRVGPDEAERISRAAREHGTAVHGAVEALIEGIVPTIPTDDCRAAFRSLFPDLAAIDNIHALETPMYSDNLRLAGRCDCIAEYDGILSVVDFKTARKPKRREWIYTYLLQVAAYGEMYYERTGCRVRQGIVLVATPVTPRAQRFVVDLEAQLPALRNLVAEFYGAEAHREPQLQLGNIA